MTDFNLNMHTARLLMQEPFFASLSRRIDKTPTDSIPTAGVCINPERQQFELLYNPKFFAQLSDEHKLGILMHEFYHIIFEHITKRKPEDGIRRIDKFVGICLNQLNFHFFLANLDTALPIDLFCRQSGTIPVSLTLQKLHGPNDTNLNRFSAPCRKANSKY